MNYYLKRKSIGKMTPAVPFAGIQAANTSNTNRRALLQCLFTLRADQWGIMALLVTVRM